jgi:hypothetical protein
MPLTKEKILANDWYVYLSFYPMTFEVTHEEELKNAHLRMFNKPVEPSVFKEEGYWLMATHHVHNGAHIWRNITLDEVNRLVKTYVEGLGGKYD